MNTYTALPPTSLTPSTPVLLSTGRSRRGSYLGWSSEGWSSVPELHASTHLLMSSLEYLRVSPSPRHM